MTRDRGTETETEKIYPLSLCIGVSNQLLSFFISISFDSHSLLFCIGLDFVSFHLWTNTDRATTTNTHWVHYSRYSLHNNSFHEAQEAHKTTVQNVHGLDFLFRCIYLIISKNNSFETNKQTKHGSGKKEREEERRERLNCISIPTTNLSSSNDLFSSCFFQLPILYSFCLILHPLLLNSGLKKEISQAKLVISHQELLTNNWERERRAPRDLLLLHLLLRFWHDERDTDIDTDESS